MVCRRQGYDAVLVFPQGNPQMVLSPEVLHKLNPKLGLGPLSHFSPSFKGLWETTSKHGQRVSRWVLWWTRCDWPWCSCWLLLFRPWLGKGRWSSQSHDQKELGQPCWNPTVGSDMTIRQGLRSPSSLLHHPSLQIKLLCWWWCSCQAKGALLMHHHLALYSELFCGPLGCPDPIVTWGC